MRPQKDRIVGFNPDVSYFKPRGIPMLDLEEVRLTVDELEALRLSDLLDFSHEEGGRHMGVSRATFGRILQKARHTVAEALIQGKAINIEGGHYQLTTVERIFECRACGRRWHAAPGTGRPEGCPQCGDTGFQRVRASEGLAPSGEDAPAP
jgi:predicted DNA-binding protein (UPF0251 family)